MLDAARADVEDHVVRRRRRRPRPRARAHSPRRFCATTASTGSTISRPSPAALAKISRAVGRRSRSHSDLPTALSVRGEKGVGHAAADDQRCRPWRADCRAGRAWSRSWRRRRSPRAAAAARPTLSERLELVLHGAAGIGRQAVRDALDRSMRAVRRGKGVVDEDVAELARACATKSGSFFSSPAWKRVFSRHRMSPGFMACDRRFGRPRRCNPARRRPAARSRSATAAATGSSDCFGSRPFGRPKWESRMTLPPLSAISRWSVRRARCASHR